MDYSELKAELNLRDRFAAVNGMRLTVVEEGYAEAVLDITEEKYNMLNILQGGAAYTLADFAFAGAANANPEGKRCIGVSSSINYLRPGTGKQIKAKARLVHRGRRTCVCNVELCNDDGKLVATATLTGFFIEQKDGK